MWRTLLGEFSIGNLTFLAGSFLRLRGLLEQLLTGFSSVAGQALYLDDLFSFFEIEPEIVSPADPRPFPNPIREGFTFEDVGFCYPGAERWAVRNLSFHLRAGEVLALVGENGAGKTTLVKLLARLYDPDEGRILRFLALSGPQPAVDVRAGLPLASELVSQGRTMIGEESGCLHGDRIHPYLDNLHRLGLIWFSREPVKEPRRYQVLEAQPDVVEALGKGGRLARTVRRSILLTPFGEDFCAVCLTLEDAAVDPPGPGNAPAVGGPGPS